MHHKPLKSRGDWIRTSDLLNPIQEASQPNAIPDKPVMATPTTACTSACTTDQNTCNGDTVSDLISKLVALSREDRDRLAAMLLGNPGEVPNKEQRAQ